MQHLRAFSYFVFSCLLHQHLLPMLLSAMLLQQFPGRHIPIANPPALPHMEIHCALCNRRLLTSLQKSSHSREKPALRCINVDYPQSRGNKKLLLCAVRDNDSPQNATLNTQKSKHGNHCCSETMPSRLEKILENIKIQCLKAGTETHMQASK